MNISKVEKPYPLQSTRKKKEVVTEYRVRRDVPVATKIHVIRDIRRVSETEIPEPKKRKWWIGILVNHRVVTFQN